MIFQSNHSAQNYINTSNDPFLHKYTLSVLIIILIFLVMPKALVALKLSFTSSGKSDSYFSPRFPVILTSDDFEGNFNQKKYLIFFHFIDMIDLLFGLMMDWGIVWLFIFLYFINNRIFNGWYTGDWCDIINTVGRKSDGHCGSWGDTYWI